MNIKVKTREGVELCWYGYDSSWIKKRYFIITIMTKYERIIIDGTEYNLIPVFEEEWIDFDITSWEPSSFEKRWKTSKIESYTGKEQVEDNTSIPEIPDNWKKKIEKLDISKIWSAPIDSRLFEKTNEIIDFINNQ